MTGEIGHFTRGAMRTSKRLIFSYIVDWVLILAIAGLGVVFNQLSATNKRPFVLQDPSLSYPYKKNTVSIAVAGIVALVVPAGVMFLCCMILVPGAGAPKGTPRSLIWRRKLWEWNTAWMGLALSCAAAFMITEGLKDLAGKPRPHAIAVCDPDLSLISRFQVSPLQSTQEIYETTVPIRVTTDICRNQDPHALRDAFASWPSGHSSFAFAGLLYFAFFLSAKFAVTIPFLNPISFRKQQQETSTFRSRLHHAQQQAMDTDPSGHSETTLGNAAIVQDTFAPRNQAAAPPVYLLIVCFLPIGAAIFICVSRWFDYHHHGLDILSGALLGIFTAWFSFRWYHMPIRRGAGWSWGPRSRGRAFWIGVGRETYVGEEGWNAKRYDGQIAQHNRIATKDQDLEAGPGNVGSTSYEKQRIGSSRGETPVLNQAAHPAHLHAGEHEALVGDQYGRVSADGHGGAGRYDLSNGQYGRAV